VQTHTQVPERLDTLFRAGDDHRVKTKEESRERGNQRPKENLFFHAIGKVDQNQYFEWKDI
jgi:hypothetical protein